MNITWTCKSFQQLSTAELYALLQLRSEVFVVEQQCVFQDLDDKDASSMHLLGMEGDTVVAYTRLLPPGLSYAEQSIGRVVVKEKFRGTGLGETLMRESINKSYELFGRHTIKIGAQGYLKKFYSSFGFEQCSEIYDEDGIDHIKMKLHYP